jgi:DNA-directed RNA polymerase subunit RPC12/RpoP
MSEGANDDELLRQFLADRSVPCPRCGYDLRGSAGANCPECGWKLRLGVEQGAPAITAWVVGLIPLVMTLGFSVLFLVPAVVVMGFDLEMFPWWWSGGIALFAIVIWVVLRRWHARRSIAVQWSLAIACCMLPIVHVIFFARWMLQVGW